MSAGLQLHLGCGNDRWEGWVNIDREAGPAVDQVMDIRDLAAHFAPGSCRSIHLMHAINYLTLWEARGFFATCLSLLEPGGELALETADAAKAARRFLDAMGTDYTAYLEGIRAFPGFGLDHLAERRSYTGNSMVWTPWHMERELLDAGFDHVQVTEPQTHAKWRDFRVEAVKAEVAGAGQMKRARRVLFVIDEEVGHVTAHLRAQIFVQPLAQRGWEATVLDARRDGTETIVRAARRADAVVMAKVPSLSLLREVRAVSRGPVLFDFTDALWMPHHQSHGWQDLHALLSESDALLCDNPAIAGYGLTYNPHVHLWPATTRVELFDAARASRAVRTDDVVRIGWVGSQGTATALQQLVAPLSALARTTPNLELAVWGCDPSAVPVIPGVRVSVTSAYTEAEMIEAMIGLDIGVFPAPAGLEDFRNRGPLKGLLYMSAALPVVVQRGGELDDIIVQGVSGFTADGPEEWTQHLTALALDPALRRTMGAAARAAMNGRTLEAITDSLVSILDAELVKPRVPASAKRRPKVLLLADVPGWIFERHARTLQSMLADEFEFTVGFHGQHIDEQAFDLIYALEYNLLAPESIASPWKYVTSLRSHISWDGVPPALLAQYLSRHYQRTHVVSRRLQELFAPHLPSVEYVTHGIDLSRFTPVERVRAPGDTVLRVGWAGNRASPAKGFDEFIRPLESIPGVELVVRGFSDRHLSLDEMPAFYAGIDVYICTSSTEGNNNSLLEAAAMGCAIVTTDTGTVPEYLKHGVAALIVPRTASAFRNAVVRLRDDPALRRALGDEAARVVNPAWSWAVRAEDYRRFLREAVEGVEAARMRMQQIFGDASRRATTASALNTLQQAMAAGDLALAQESAAQLVLIDPTNADFRTLYRELHPAS